MKWLGRAGLVAAVVAATAGVWWAWGRVGSTTVVTQTATWAGVVGAAGLLVAAGTSTIQAVAGYRRWLGARPDVAGQVKFSVKGRLPKVGEVDVTRLGAKAPIGSVDAGQTSYVARDVDVRVDELIAAGGMVVLAGPAAAGKSRLAAEAIHRVGTRGKRRLLVPVGAGPLRALAKAGFGFTDTIIVLDDLEHFLTDGGLDTALLGEICAPDSSVVVATIRSKVLADLERALNADLAGRTSFALYRPGVELLKALRDEGRIIEVTSDLSTREKDAAAAVQVPAGDVRISEAVASPAGFGEYLIAGPAQMARWTRDTGDALETVGRAVISAAVDARRAGFNDPLPAHVLDQLTPAYLPERFQGRATTPTEAAGRAWAAETITGTTASSCITHHKDGTYTAADYLTDRADQPPSTLSEQAVPDQTWTILQTHATPQQAFNIANAADGRQRHDIAFTATRRAAVEGHTDAMNNLGVLFQEHGDLDGAETWFRRAADEGHTGAMNNLGDLFQEHDDLDGAETWFRRAADEGETVAMLNLGNLLGERGDLGAESWFRRAASEGETVAMFYLGNLLRKRGDLGGAETWFRRAADEGETVAMFYLGNLLGERGDLDGAETWFRRAADEGDIGAMFNLGVLHQERGDLGEAEAWFRRAADEGDIGAMFYLGVLFQERGDLDRAESCYRRAADEGDIGAMFYLGVLFQERGDLDRAESCS
ncbi:tetratricopeptide/SEL1-like repeat protein, partial [Phytomonospora sp. NPDC050363]|uniref:tetratricopeptide repeat protein n=1 Tax=Phytomonospora sp. NPDC050363 TaxID=3155642 RepID=UPI0033F68FF7